MIKPRYLHHFPITNPPDLDPDWSNNTVDVHFLAEDMTPYVLTMHVRVLEQLQERIADVLADKNRPNPHWRSDTQSSMP